MGHREQAGTEGPEQTPTAKVGDTEGWQRLEGMPLPLHSARVRQGWGEGMCRGAPGAEACHEGGEVPNRKSSMGRSQVSDSSPGWVRWLLYLENTGFRFLGLLGFQVPVPVPLSRPVLTPTRPCLKCLQMEENVIILGRRVGWGGGWKNTLESSFG